MPYGTGSNTLQTIPVGSYVSDGPTFWEQTERNQERIEVQPITPGRPWVMPLPQVGVVQKIRTFITGTITVAATKTATPSNLWPYGLLEDVKLSCNGQNDLHSLSGIDLHVMRCLRYPAYSEAVDVFPGGALGGGPGGAGGSTIAAGTYPVHLTYEQPVATDESQLIGALFAQSSAANISIRRQVAALTDLFSAGAADVTLNLTAHTFVVRYEIPINADGALVVPDLSRLHALNATDKQFSGTGAVDVPMVRSAGQLHRLLVRVHADTDDRLIPSAVAAAAKRIDGLRLQYGGNKRPLDFEPISELQSQSNEWYGSVLPYDTMCIDLVRENPARDVLILQGVTELKVVPIVNAAATVDKGVVHLVQQTLFQGG